MYLTYYFYNLFLKLIFNKKTIYNKTNNKCVLGFKNYYSVKKLFNKIDKSFYVLNYSYLKNFDFSLNFFLFILLKFKNLNLATYSVSGLDFYTKNNLVFLKNSFYTVFNYNYKYFYLNKIKRIFNSLNLVNLNNFNIKFSVTDFFKYLNNKTINNLNILFLRKNKVFNKGRYSRNRQYYRTGVYWCLYVNIVAVVGLYFWFYRFNMNFGYLWWIMYIFIFSIFFSRANSLNVLNLKLLFYQIFNSFVWFYSIFFNFFKSFLNFFFSKLIL